MPRPCIAFPVLCALLIGGCAELAPAPPASVERVAATQASAGPLAVVSGEALTDNDAAFSAKLQLIEEARESLDLAYYIFADDYSSSLLSQALIDAARRGVRVRLLVDYFSAYRDLDRFSWLERQGEGRLEVRLYNRPTLQIVQDAAYLTLACADVGATGGTCDEAKTAAVGRQFAPDVAAGRNVTNRSFAGSALFLSGLYGKNAKLMAYAVSRGQQIDAEALASRAGDAGGSQTEQLKRLGKLYFKARYAGGAEALEARLRLAFVRLAFAEKVNPVFDTVGGYLPLARQNDAQAQRDWDYLTEFLHHKFLLADRSRLILGGRNVEDAYHMHPGPLADKYVFMDTDLRLQLAGPDPKLAASFDRLWHLDTMVATLDEVRQHAPNDLLENFAVLSAAQEACAEGRDAACVDRALDRHFVPLDGRMAAIAARHRERIERYRREYRRTESPPPMPLDATATIHYLENLPITDGRRNYGVRHGREAESSKHIQALWRTELQAVCAAGTPAPREVIVHNAYLFLPAGLLQDLAAMLDGRRPCGGVAVTLLTNSLATTDLNVVNLLAVWELKALADHLRESGPAPGAASLRYLEYQSAPPARLSLHSKLMVFDREIFVGSANADLRSLMMDSNNGLLVRDAPGFVAAYKAWLASVVATPGRIADRTATLGRDAAELESAMSAQIDALIARYAGSDRLDDAQRAELKQRVLDATGRVYALSRRILRGDRDAADEFNALFKAI